MAICLASIVFLVSYQLTKPSYNSITPEELSNLISSSNVVLVDVRTQEEYESGHIPNTEYNIDVKYESFLDKANLLLDKDTPVALYCRSGNRSKTAADILSKDGYTVYELVTGFNGVAEVAAWAKDNGKSLYELLMDIYVEYGFSKEVAVSVVKPGKSGADEIKQMMENFRANPPKEMAGIPIVCSKDYKKLEARDGEGNVTKLDMPETSNVLQYFTADGDKVSVRPSGTEPKIKFYMEAKGAMATRADYAEADAKAMEKIEAMKKSLGI